jgi:integrase
MPSTVLVDISGRRRSPATLPAFHAGRPPHNKGLRYPADPPNVEQIIAVMHAAGDDAEGVRLRGLIIVLWRAGLRVSEALSLAESDLDAGRGAILVRRGLCRIRHSPRLTRIDPRRSSRSVSLSESASLIRSPARQSTTIKPLRRLPYRAWPARRMTAMISSTVGGSAA